MKWRPVVALCVALAGCTTLKPVQPAKPPAPPVMASQPKVMAQKVAVPEQRWQLAWNYDTPNTIFNIEISFDLVTWGLWGNTTNTFFPLDSSLPAAYFRVGVP